MWAGILNGNWPKKSAPFSCSFGKYRMNNTMQPFPLDEGKIKQLMQEALVETLQEQRGIFHDLIVEAIEDIAMTNAIRQGVNTESASRNEGSDILKGRA